MLFHVEASEVLIMHTAGLCSFSKCTTTIVFVSLFFLHIKIVSVMVLCSDHKRDAARAEDALTLSYGSELIGMQRDWNEELQSCREFPHGTPQERYI